ncbi:MAG: hypothetical protein HY319_23875 [Armatimonadetes bacterium]|nr:hypothetical protein [Armatimonadota bacterium]
MKQQPTTRTLIAAALSLLVVVLFVFAYLLPRLGHNRELATEIQSLEEGRGELSTLLSQVDPASRSLPPPQPDVPSWIAANTLTGMERKLVSNDPFRKGQGAQVRLRNVPPEQVAGFLNRLVQVRLQVLRLLLQDWDGNGKWEVEVFLAVPEGAVAPPGGAAAPPGAAAPSPATAPEGTDEP